MKNVQLSNNTEQFFAPSYFRQESLHIIMRKLKTKNVKAKKKKICPMYALKKFQHIFQLLKKTHSVPIKHWVKVKHIPLCIVN